MSTRLNLPPISVSKDAPEIRCRLRKKLLKNTPEEWVRQHFIHYLIEHLGYPAGRLVSEYKVNYNGMNKRCDIALIKGLEEAELIVECKAPKIKITEDTFYQIAKYANILKAPLLILTNGIEHYCALMDYKTGKLVYLPNIPTYEALRKQTNS